MIKLLHWCSLRMSSAGILLVRFGHWLWRCGGGLECWCDSHAERKRWLAYAKKHKISIKWLDVPELRPEDFAMPAPGEYPFMEPRPITMLDEWGQDDA